MKFIEKLTNDLNAGRLDGIKVKCDFHSNGNIYTYILSDDTWYGNYRQGTNALAIIRRFLSDNGITAIDITPPSPHANWCKTRTETPYNPTERAPSFKSKW